MTQEEELVEGEVLEDAVAPDDPDVVDEPEDDDVEEEMGPEGTEP